MVGGAGRTFLVESYVPGLDERAAATLSSRLRKAVLQLGEEGLTPRWGGSFALLAEETYICIILAGDVEHVVELFERAGLEHDHVVQAFAIDPPVERCR